MEAIIYVTEEPVTAEQIAAALAQASPETPPSKEDIGAAISALIEEYQTDTRGIEIREVAGGLKMATKPEHHEAVRQFVKSLKPPIRLSLAALETLAVIAYRQPVTVPEIQDVRGVHAASVIKTLLEKKLITTAGRKEVIGRPVLYRTTRDFLVQFGLKDLSELPSLKEFEELSKAAMLEPGTAPAETSEEAAEGRPPEAQPPEGEAAEPLELETGLPALEQHPDAALPASDDKQAADADLPARESAQEHQET